MVARVVASAWTKADRARLTGCDAGELASLVGNLPGVRSEAHCWHALLAYRRVTTPSARPFHTPTTRQPA